jgi:hypothetical protein
MIKGNRRGDNKCSEIFVCKSGRQRPLRRLTYYWNENTKMDLNPFPANVENMVSS